MPDLVRERGLGVAKCRKESTEGIFFSNERRSETSLYKKGLSHDKFSPKIFATPPQSVTFVIRLPALRPADMAGLTSAPWGGCSSPPCRRKQIKIRPKWSYFNLVRERGLEPPRPKALAPKASVSTNSTTRAYNYYSHASVSTVAHRPPLAHIT